MRRGHDVVSQDASPAIADLCRRHLADQGLPTEQVRTGLIEDIDAQERYDNVVALDVIEHIEDDAAAVRAMRDALAPGGTLLITVPAVSRLYGPKDVAIGHFRRYDRDQLAGLLRGEGLAGPVAAVVEPDRRARRLAHRPRAQAQARRGLPLRRPLVGPAAPQRRPARVVPAGRGADAAADRPDAHRVRETLQRLTSGRWATAWRLLSAVAIVAFGLTQIDLDEVGDALADLFLPLAALSWAILLAGQAISGLRWGVIAERIGARSSPAWFVRAYLRGAFYNAFLPTGIGGDAMKIAVLRHDLGLKDATRSVVIDRASGLAAICLAAGACLPFTPYLDDLPALQVAIAVVALAAAVVTRASCSLAAASAASSATRCCSWPSGSAASGCSPRRSTSASTPRRCRSSR